MKHIFTISLCFLALSLSAQETITYPYNPDGDADGLVAVPDIQDLLAVYGSPFSPAEIMVGDTALSEWIQILYQALQDQQAVIESLTSGAGASGCDFNYPHGLDGTPYSHSFSSQGDLIIPEGKVFYMTHEVGYEGNVTINGGVYEPNIDAGSSIQVGDDGNPIIYTSGLILSDVDGSNINGLMIDENTNIDVVFHSFGTGDLVVPEGKNLYLTRTTTNIVSSLNDVSYSFEVVSSSQPIVLPPESTISPASTYSSTNKFLFGYLVDEDYFADCGGGGSSEGEGTDGLTLQNCNNQTTITYYEYEYDLIGIGDQCWFAENLRAKNFNNGEPITQGILANDNDYYQDGLDPKGFDYPCLPLNGSADGDILAEEWFGLMYSGFCAIDNNVCPAGFHVPTITDFEILMSVVGSEVYMNGAKLLDNYPWTYGTNEMGFSARLAAPRNSDGCSGFDQALFMSSEGSINGNGIIKTSLLAIDGDGYLSMDELSAVEWAAPIRCIKD